VKTLKQTNLTKEKSFRENLYKSEPYSPGEQISAPGLIKLNTNENPYPPSPKFMEYLGSFPDSEALRLYPDPDAEALKLCIADSEGLDKENIIVGNGSDEILAFAFRAFFNGSKEVLFPDVTYSFYKVWCELFDIPWAEIPVDENFRIRVSDYRRPNGGIVIANPNTPTGIGEDLDHIEEMLCNDSGSLLIVDEAYEMFSGMSAAPLLKKYDNLFITRTFSKAYSLAGVRLGAGFGSPELINAIEAVRNSFNPYSVGCFGLRLGAAALKEKEYYKEQAGKIVKTRDNCAETLRALGFKVLDSRANFLFVSYPGLSGEYIYKSLKNRNILVRYFVLPRVKDWIRITVGTDEQMDRLINSVKEIING